MSVSQIISRYIAGIPELMREENTVTSPPPPKHFVYCQHNTFFPDICQKWQKKTVRVGTKSRLGKVSRNTCNFCFGLILVYFRKWWYAPITLVTLPSVYKSKSKMLIRWKSSKYLFFDLYDKTSICFVSYIIDLTKGNKFSCDPVWPQLLSCSNHKLPSVI